MTTTNTPALRFKEFDGDLNTFKLYQVSKIYDCEHKTAPYIEYSEYFVVRTSNIKHGKLDYTDIRYTDKNGYEEWTKRTQPKFGDILFTREAPAGESCIVPKNKKIVMGQRIVLIRSEQNQLASKFLLHHLNSQKSSQEIQKFVIGTTVQRINISDINDIELSIPPLEEQTKIANFLTVVDDKINELSQKHELLTEYKKGVMQQLFSQKIRFKKDDGSDFGDWEESEIGELLDLHSRPQSKPNMNYHALGVRSHFKGLFNKYNSDPSKISMDTLYVVKKDDVVVNITFAWEGAMAIAKKEHENGLVSHRFPTYQCSPKLLVNYFKYRFTQKDFQHQLQLCSPGGAGRNRVLNKSKFLKIKIQLPSIEEQTKIAEFLTELDEQISHTQTELDHAKTWKKGLLQKMFV